jgi:two-component system, cell cycle sensor histidine kinase and response regulator CckA
VYLPDLKQPLMSPEALLGTETVLLVDDDEAFRNVVRAFLQSSGYNVLEARSVSEAARIATKYNGTIDLLLTDIVLPDVNGDQLGDYLRFLHPKMSVIYMSGYGDTVQFAGVGSQVGARMLPKPFSKKTLLLAVRELLHWREQRVEAAIPRRTWYGTSNLVPSWA